jgi:diphosphomevalonate decarboxylase
MKTATAVACANIALVKYWGKRDSELNLPAAGSLSLTLDALRTTTSVCFDSTLTSDDFSLDGEQAGTARLTPWLDLVRQRAGIQTRARVSSRNDFPTASGLASSASAFAALATAASEAAGLGLNAAERSELARRGSGSAARSIYPGLVLMNAGSLADGSDAIATPLSEGGDWDLRMVVAIVDGGKVKKVSSRDAMEHCAATSPLYRGWLDSVPGDLETAQEAIRARDLAALGAVTTHSAMAMHAAAMASRPPIRYWQAATLEILDTVLQLGEQGLHAYPTMDAGPHVKVLTCASDSEQVRKSLALMPSVSEVIVSAPGPGATLEES